MADIGADTATVVTAPSVIKDRFKKLGVYPHDMNAGAKPGGNATTVTKGINDAIATGEKVLFERGNYPVDGTIYANPKGADEGWYRHFVFSETQFTAGGPVTNYEECLGCDRTWDGTKHLAGPTASGTLKGRSGINNIPAPPNSIHVLFDLSQARGSTYDGNLFLHGGNRDGGFANTGPKLALLSCSNKWNKEVFGGGAESSWNGMLQFAQSWCGMYGTPKYNPYNGNTHYPDTFVGSNFSQCRFANNVCHPIIAGGNTIDDTWITHLNTPMMTGGRSYLQATALTVGNFFVNGHDPDDIAIDIHSSMLSCALFYAENKLWAPIVARDEGWVSGIMKHGAGSPSSFTKKCVVFFDGTNCGGNLIAHERSGNAANMASLVRVNCAAAGKSRTVSVMQTYPESVKPAFFAEGGAASNDHLLVTAPGANQGFSRYVRDIEGPRGLRRQTLPWANAA